MERMISAMMENLRNDIALRSKKGISFIIASTVLWAAISIVWLLTAKSIEAKNLYTFFCAAPLVPLAYFVSRIIKAEFAVKDNALNKLGMLFTMNQLLYLLLAIWAFSGIPDKMVMIIAIIFGAHLLPFSWLYKSRAYLVMSIGICLVVVILGWSAKTTAFIPLFMTAAELVFSIWLSFEIHKLKAS